MDEPPFFPSLPLFMQPTEKMDPIKSSPPTETVLLVHLRELDSSQGNIITSIIGTHGDSQRERARSLVMQGSELLLSRILIAAY
jgi:hypothetical protein